MVDGARSDDVIYAVGNDADAWDLRFTAGEWDAVGGEALTARFGECILEHLPLEVVVACQRGRVLDFGCARGQFVGMLRHKFPQAVVDGMDHSPVGINQARAYFPDSKHGHMIQAIGLFTDYDVVFTSNVLEHLVDPVGTVMGQLRFTRKFYVILVPYDEPLGGWEREQMTVEQRHAAGHTHVQKFQLGDFPAELGAFTRTVENATIEPGPICPGRQLLVVYKRV
jgi:SAM-dependent methyltransferase